MIEHRLRLPGLLALVLLGGTPALAQRGDVATAGSAEVDVASQPFSVVSIRQAVLPDDAIASVLSMAGQCGLPFVQLSAQSVRIPVTTLCGLIRVAYDVNEYQVVGLPQELTKGDASNFLEIQAGLERSSAPSLDGVRPMLRAMLAERFELRVRRAPREVGAYALVVAKGEPKFAPCSDPDAASGYVPGRITNCKPPRMAMSRLAQMLTRETRRAVVDQTGLSGTPAFELRWLPEGVTADAGSPPSLVTALQEQLSLKLESQRVTVDAVVVEHATRPTSN